MNIQCWFPIGMNCAHLSFFGSKPQPAVQPLNGALLRLLSQFCHLFIVQLLASYFLNFFFCKMEVIMVPTLRAVFGIKGEVLLQCLECSKCSINPISQPPMLCSIYFYYSQSAVGKPALTHWGPLSHPEGAKLSRGERHHPVFRGGEVWGRKVTCWLMDCMLPNLISLRLNFLPSIKHPSFPSLILCHNCLTKKIHISL